MHFMSSLKFFEKNCLMEIEELNELSLTQSEVGPTVPQPSKRYKA